MVDRREHRRQPEREHDHADHLDHRREPEHPVVGVVGRREPGVVHPRPADREGGEHEADDAGADVALGDEVASSSAACRTRRRSSGRRAARAASRRGASRRVATGEAAAVVGAVLEGRRHRRDCAGRPPGPLAAVHPTGEDRGAMSRTVLIVIAALVCGAITAAMLLTSDYLADKAVWAVFGPAVGWSFIGTGLYAQRRRPESRAGTLMVLLGFAWFANAIGASNSPLLYTIGLITGGLWGGVFLHLVMTFPSGRISSGRRPRDRDRRVPRFHGRERAGDAVRREGRPRLPRVPGQPAADRPRRHRRDDRVRAPGGPVRGAVPDRAGAARAALAAHACARAAAAHARLRERDADVPARRRSRSPAAGTR